MNSRTLGISWLHGRLTLATAHGPVWTCPVPTSTGDAFRSALREGLAASGIRARQALVVVDHRSLLFHVQETPPAQGRMLDQVIDRLVTEHRFFAEPALWTRAGIPAGSGATRSLLAIMPRALFTLIEDAASENGLELAGLFPVASVLATGLRRAAVTPDERLLLVTSVGDAHAIVFGDGTGRVLFSRSVTGTHEPTGIRLDQEINRTRHFIQQQLGTPVARVVRTSGGPSNDPAPGTDLARAVLGMPRDASFNFHLRHGRAPRWMRPLVISAAVTGLAASVAIAVLVELAVQRHRALAERAQATLQFDRDAAHRRDAVQEEGERLTAFLQAVGTPESPSVPAVFPRYLREKLPPTFRLTSLSVRPSTNGWMVTLEGRAKDRGTRFLAAAEKFERDLAEGPFGILISDSTHRRTVAAAPGRPIQPASARPRIPGEDEEQPFHLTGVIR